MRWWNWIKSFFVRPVSTEPANVYSPKERAIYHYFDGTRIRSVDPMVLYEKVQKQLPAIEQDAQGAKAADLGFKKADECYHRLMDTLRSLFDVKPLTDLGDYKTEGLGNAEVAALYQNFWEYVEGVIPTDDPDQEPQGGVKKNSPPSPTPAAGTSVATPSSPDASPPTKSSSASGSTESGPSTAPPEPSSEVSK